MQSPLRVERSRSRQAATGQEPTFTRIKLQEECSVRSEADSARPLHTEENSLVRALLKLLNGTEKLFFQLERAW